MIENIRYIKNIRMLDLFTVEWLPSNVKEYDALVFVFHGFAEHMMSGYTSSLVKFLCEKKMVVCGFDYMGHGQSQGTRGYISSINDLVEDGLNFISMIKKIHVQDIPIFFYGYSFGTSVACGCYRILGPNIVRGIIMESGLLSYNRSMVNYCILCIGYTLSCCFPCAIVKTFETDPDDKLRVHKLRADSANVMFSSINKTVETVQKHACCPILIAHGSMDDWVPLDNVIEIIDGVKTATNISLRIFLQSGHNIRYDSSADAETFIKEVIKWIQNNIK